MKSNEIFRKMFKKTHPKELAGVCGAKPGMMYKWGEEGESHRRNPAETLMALMLATGDYTLLHHLCERCGGVFVPVPRVKHFAPQAKGALLERMLATHLHYFSAISRLVTDGEIADADIAHLRRLLNEDIAAGEELIQAAERGAFKPSMPCRWFDPRTRNCRRRWKRTK